MLDAARDKQFACPLVVGVTGHRDIVDSEIDGIAKSINELFRFLRARFPSTPLRLISALAEGADRIAAITALESGVELQIVLPMDQKEYAKDFATAESREEFFKLCASAEVLVLPPPKSGENGNLSSSDYRELCYANAGIFISAHCHILLAIWDGLSTDRVGGTSQIVYFQHYDRLSGIAESVPRTSLFLTDTESDLVFHIRCGRKSANSKSEETLVPASPCWFTTDQSQPRVKALPQRYARVFDRTDEFNADIAAMRNRRGKGESISGTVPKTERSTAAKSVSAPFEIADQLADHYQKYVSRSLISIHAFAVLAATMILLYSEVAALRPLLFYFLAFVLTGIALAAIANRRDWHRKYLDYRVLAEGLRVQYYWAVAGVHSEGQTKFAYDNFLRQRDMDLGWIRNVMRVAGTRVDAQPVRLDEEGLKYVLDEWIGAAGGKGQLQYYRTKAREKARINRITESLVRVSLWAGIGIGLFLAFFLDDFGHRYESPLIILMGILPLIAGVAETYTQRKADRELTKQYEFMAQVFANARRRIDDAVNDGERREVLQGLGDAALTEHAEWILIHRDRQPDASQI